MEYTIYVSRDTSKTKELAFTCDSREKMADAILLVEGKLHVALKSDTTLRGGVYHCVVTVTDFRYKKAMDAIAAAVPSFHWWKE